MHSISFLLLVNILPGTGQLGFAAQRSSAHPEEPIYLLQNTNEASVLIVPKSTAKLF